MYEIFEQLLQEYGVTAYKVAKEAGVSQSMLSEWKKGVYTPKQDKLKKIADYFGVTVDYLMGNENTELEIPEVLKGVPVAFHRGEFEGLTQQEVDALAKIAETLKQQRTAKGE